MTRKITMVDAGQVDAGPAQILVEESLCRGRHAVDIREDAPQDPAAGLVHIVPFVEFEPPISGRKQPAALRGADAEIVTTRTLLAVMTDVIIDGRYRLMPAASAQAREYGEYDIATGAPSRRSVRVAEP